MRPHMVLSSLQSLHININIFLKIGYTCTATATGKSLQSYPTLCNPIDSSSPGSPVPQILQARILEQGAIAFSDIYVHMYTIPN